MADLYDIGFKDIYNAPSGGKSLEDIVKSMYEVIRDSGKFGTGDDARDRSLSDIEGMDWMFGGEDYWNQGQQPSETTIIPFQAYTPPPTDIQGATGTYNKSPKPYYNLETLLGKMGGIYGEGGTKFEDEDDVTEGMKKLYLLLGGGDSAGGINLQGLKQDYMTDMGDINTEITSKMKSLQGGLRSQGKESRYGNIGSGGKPIGQPGRKGYLADHYELLSQKQDLTSKLQEEIEKQFSANISSFQTGMGA